MPNIEPSPPAKSPYLVNFFVISLSSYPKATRVPVFILSSSTNLVIVVRVTRAATRYKNTGKIFDNLSTTSETTW